MPIKLKRGSILRNIIFLNSLNILIISLIISIILIWFVFREFEKSLYNETEISINTFANIFKGNQEDLSKKASKFSKNSDIMLAITDSVLQYENRSYEVKKGAEEGEFIYSFIYRDISQNKAYNMKRLASYMLDYITGGGRRFGIDEKFLSVFDADGKKLATTMLVPEQKEYDLTDNTEFINSILNIGTPFKNVFTDVYYDTEKTENGLVIRGAAPMRFNKAFKGALVLSQVIEKKFAEDIGQQIRFKKDTKVFFLRDGEYLVGELDIARKTKFFNLNEGVKKSGKAGYFLERKKINGKDYICAYSPIKNFKGDVIGFIGLANTREEIKRAEIITLIVIALITIIIIITASIINTFFSYKIIKPLIVLQTTANKIAHGKYSEEFEIIGSSEIKDLSLSLKEMLTKIKDYMRNLRTIEEVVSIIHSEKDEDKVLFYILSIISSKRGLNCKRSFYVEYNESENILKGKAFASNIFTEENNNSKEMLNEKENEILDYELNAQNFKAALQGNIFAEAFNENKSIYSTEIGEDESVIRDLGFKNYFILPVTYENRKYGLLVVEAISNEEGITEEESDILKIFTTNLAIYFENKRLERESLKAEKLTTIIKLASSIVHELRTPITSIRGFATMLKKGYGEENKVQRYTDLIIKDSFRIDGMAEDLLDYAEGSKYKYKYTFKKIELRQTVFEVFESLKTEISANGITSEFEVDKDLSLFADEQKFKKVIYNMIKNSIEASRGENDVIQIRGFKDGGKIKLLIKDNGSGIPEDIMPIIFEPMITTKLQGTGLGLTIAMDILNAHGYSLDIKSEVNKGTEITILM